MTQHVVLVGSDVDYLEGVAGRLRHFRVECRRTSDADQAICAVGQSRVDAVLAEAVLPDSGIVELCKQLRNALGDVPVLVCAERIVAIEAVMLYESGADDYFEKSVESVIVDAKLLRALERHRQTTRTIEQLCARQSLFSRPAIPIDPQQLTRFEERILTALVTARGDVVPVAAIANELWMRSNAGARAIYGHIATLRAKLLAVGWTIVNHRGKGYRLKKQLTEPEIHGQLC